MEDNVIFVGQKNLGIYTKAIMSMVEKNGFTFVRTRGKHIQKAINVTTYLAKTKNLKISDIELSGEEFKGNDEKVRIIPSFSIKLSK